MVRIDPDELIAFGAEVVETMGTSPDVARQVSESLVSADLRGHTSHGVLRIPLYDDMVGDPIQPSAEPTITHEDATTAHVDGNCAFGQAVGRLATELAVTKAKENGVAAVGIRNSMHLGRIGEWAERGAEDGVVFGGFCKGRGGSVAFAGSAQRRIGTNPMTWGIPTFDALDHQIVLDMATSQVARGKIRDAAAAAETIPGEWTTTPEGDPVTDAEAFEYGGEGVQLPFGGRVSGYKGTAMALIVELMGATFGDAPIHGEHDDPPSGYNDAAFIAVDPTRFTTRERMRERVTALRDYVRETEYSDDIPAGGAGFGDEAILPGEGEHETAERQRREGIDLSNDVAIQLRELAEERDIEDTIPPAIASL